MKVLKGWPVALAAVFCSLQFTAHAQAQWEVNTIRGINPIEKSGFVKFVSNSAEPIAVAVPVGIFVASLTNGNKGQKLNAYEMVTGLAISAAATLTLKAIVKRDRPYVTYSDIYPDQIDKGYSFPSAHTAVAFSTATSLMLLYKKWYIAIPAYAWATTVGYSRMYLGQHYPSDVFVGAVVGAGSAVVGHLIRKRYFERKRAPLAIRR